MHIEHEKLKIMIPNTLNSDTHVNQIEIQNEVKNTQTKNSVKESTTTNDVITTVNNLEIHNQENTRNQQHEINEEVINKVVNVDTTARNVQEHATSAIVINISRMTTDTDKKKEQVVHEYPGNQHLIIKPPEYWLQFNFNQHRGNPYGTQMSYNPDRNLFVRMVFSILLVMLILTAGYVALVYNVKSLRDIYRRYGLILGIIGAVGLLGVCYATMCIPCTRRPPWNFICLFLAVCFMSMITAFITIRYRTEIVLFALLATAVTVIVCLCLAYTRFDFTKYMLYVVAISTAFTALALIVLIAMYATGTRFKPVMLVILIIGTLLNVISLVIELQMVLGGRTIELSEDDYAEGALLLYTSIVEIFIELVQIMGILDKD